ncbi:MULTISPECIES: hypothetical protein [unclassified Nocardioides]|uniref:hypothetical protein n=1 Tax=unclassified Nocardioides TaxID=2615069 RepID=UPI003014476E
MRRLERPLPSPHPGHPGVVVPVAVDPSGRRGPTRQASRGSGWRRVSAGLFVPATVDPESVAQRIVEAAADLPPYGGVTGWAALSWAGGRWFDGTEDRPITLAIGGGNLRPDARRVLSKERLAPDELVFHDGLWLTRAVRSVCFEMRYAPSVRAAVLALEMAAYSDLVSVAECQEFVDRHLAGWTGVQQCRDALPLADENVWSPTEHEMRFLWTDAGKPRPRCNVPVFDLDGRHLGTPDLIDPETGVIGEYDGSTHLSGAQRAKDLAREDRFRKHGLHPVTMVGADRIKPAAYLDRLESTYARAEAMPASGRRWTLERPAWWTPTESVRQRRALTESDQRRLLAYRAG